MLSCWKWLRNLHEFDVSLVYNLFEAPYREDDGFGFTRVDRTDDSVISGTLIYSGISTFKFFDPQIQQLMRQDQLQFSEVSFEIDYSHSILLVRGGSGKLSRMVEILGKITDGAIQTESITFQIGDFIHTLRDQVESFSLEGLIIKHYRPLPELSGRYAVTVFSQRTGIMLAEEYGLDISEFTASLVIEGLEVQLRASSQGAFVIRGDALSLRLCLNLLKNIIVELDNGGRSGLLGH